MSLNRSTIEPMVPIEANVQSEKKVVFAGIEMNETDSLIISSPPKKETVSANSSSNQPMK